MQERKTCTVSGRRLNRLGERLEYPRVVDECSWRSSDWSFQARANLINQVSWVSRRLITHWPGWTKPGAITAATSSGTDDGVGIQDRIASRSLRFFAAEMAPFQMMRKCTTCSSAISCTAPGDAGASWSWSFSRKRLSFVRSGRPMKYFSNSSRCSTVQMATPGVRRESPDRRTSESHRACRA
jgi:hypothetical protein